MERNFFRSGRKKGFIVLYREAAQDGRLTLEARGLFALMVSLPENWEYTVSGLAVKAGCGRDKIRRLLRELQEVGYLIREQGHGQDGRFAANVYVLQDEAPPLSGETVSGETRQRSEPPAGAAAQKKREEKKKEGKEPPKAPQGAAGAKKPRRRSRAAPAWQPEKFEGFWRAYPRDEDRAKAAEQWDRLPGDRELMDRYGGSEEALLLEISRGLKRHLESREWRDSVGIPYAFRWLRDRRWTEKTKARPARTEPPAGERRVVEQEEVPVW